MPKVMNETKQLWLRAVGSRLKAVGGWEAERQWGWYTPWADFRATVET